MRIQLIGLSLALLSASAFAADKEITVEAGGKPALKLSVPAEAEVAAKGDETTIKTPSLRIYLWHVKSAKTVADAEAHVNDIIKSEFVNYKIGETKSIKVGGHEAKHITGKGEEADDNDPGTADVVIFTEGKNVFAACVHGEKDEASKERPGLMKVLESAKGL